MQTRPTQSVHAHRKPSQSSKYAFHKPQFGMHHGEPPQQIQTQPKNDEHSQNVLNGASNNEHLQLIEVVQSDPIQQDVDNPPQDHIAIPMTGIGADIQTHTREQHPHPNEGPPLDRHVRRIDQLEQIVHRIPPFTCKDVAEMTVPLGFLGGSIMFIINDCTNKDGINGKSLAGNIMTLIASVAGTGVVLHNWWDRWQQAHARRRRVGEPIEDV